MPKCQRHQKHTEHWKKREHNKSRESGSPRILLPRSKTELWGVPITQAVAEGQESIDKISRNVHFFLSEEQHWPAIIRTDACTVTRVSVFVGSFSLVIITSLRKCINLVDGVLILGADRE